MLGEAGLEAHGDIVHGPEPAQSDAGRGAPPRQLAHEIQPATVGQLDVADDQVERRSASAISGGAKVAAGLTCVAALPEHIGQVAQRIAIVLDQEDLKLPAARADSEGFRPGDPIAMAR